MEPERQNLEQVYMRALSDPDDKVKRDSLIQCANNIVMQLQT